MVIDSIVIQRDDVYNPEQSCLDTTLNSESETPAIERRALV